MARHGLSVLLLLVGTCLHSAWAGAPLQPRRLLADGGNLDLTSLLTGSGLNLQDLLNLGQDLLGNLDLGSIDLSSIEDLLTSGNLDLSSPNLQALLKKATSVNPAEYRAPVTLQLSNLTVDCPTGEDETMVSNVLRLVLGAGLNLGVHDIDVSDVACDADSLVLDLGLLGNQTDLPGLQTKLQQVALGVHTLIPATILSQLNASSVVATVLSPIQQLINSGKLCTPLPGCLFDSLNLVDLPADLEGLSNSLLAQLPQDLLANITQQVPIHVALPIKCKDVALNADALATFKQQLQSAVADLADVTADRINITQVSCGVDYLVAGVSYLVDSAATTVEWVGAVNNLTSADLLAALPAGLPKDVTSTLQTAVANLNLHDFDLNLAALTAPVATVVDGVKDTVTRAQLNLGGDCAKVVKDATSESEFKAALQAALALGLVQDPSHIDITKVICDANNHIKVQFDVVYDNSTSDAAINTTRDKLAATDPTALLPKSLTSELSITSVSPSEVVNVVKSQLPEGLPDILLPPANILCIPGSLLPTCTASPSPSSPTPGGSTPTPAPGPAPNAAGTSLASLTSTALAAGAAFMLALAL